MSKILFGITGSVAAYKSLELIRLLIQDQHEVKVVLTSAGENFITRLSIASLGATVYPDIIDYSNVQETMQHINLAKWADIIIIMPLSSNTLSKIANGLADNLLTSILLARRKNTQVILVPAMNKEMWENSIIAANTDKLKTHNYVFIGPISGLQACGDNGYGKMVEPFEVYKYLNHFIVAMDETILNLKGVKVMLTLGGTVEEIDPVRYIGNYSSGKMGLELAYALTVYGAEVTLIAANHQIALPQTLNIIEAKTADEMYKKINQSIAKHQIFISCAAVADYKALESSKEKIKKGNDIYFSINLQKTIDIVSTIKRDYPHVFVVGFAAETNNLFEYAKKKLIQKKMDMIIANNVKEQQIFASDSTAITILNPKEDLSRTFKGSKLLLSHKIIAHLTRNWGK